MPAFSRRITLAITVASLVLGVACGLFFARNLHRNSRAPVTAVTIDKTPQWHLHFLKARLSAVQPQRDQVRLTGNIYGSPEPQTRVVSVGFQFNFPDDHGSRSYSIARIEPDGVVIDYVSTFDYASFGTRLITRDTGSIKLPWFDSGTGAARDARSEAQETAWNQPPLQTTLLPNSTHSADVPMIIEKATAYFEKNCDTRPYWPHPTSVTEDNDYWWVQFTEKPTLSIQSGREVFGCSLPGVVTFQVEKTDLTVTCIPGE